MYLKIEPAQMKMSVNPGNNFAINTTVIIGGVSSAGKK